MRKVISIATMVLFAYTLAAQTAPEGLFIASHAPDFKAKDQNGVDIRLKDLLKKGKVVLVFYRGQWCPDCNKELQRFQDSLLLIRATGATLIAVTPEIPENVLKMQDKIKAQFSIISDDDLKIMKAYDVSFEVPENTITRYRNTGIDIEKANGKNGKFLPVPAVYVIDKESTVTYRFFEPDYKKRPAVKDILSML